MNIIGIVGSPHGMQGATGRLMRDVLAAAAARGAAVETVALTGKSVLPCKACDTCHKKGACPQKDDFETIKHKILESDAVVLASPNYIFSVSAQLKAFMDRCCGAIHCLGFEGKYGASVVTSGGGDEPPIVDYMNHFMMTTGMTPVGGVWATMGKISGDTFPDDIRARAADLGARLVDWCENRTTTPDIEQVKTAFKERMGNLMQYRKAEWPFEYEYWKTHHGLK